MNTEIFYAMSEADRLHLEVMVTEPKEGTPPKGVIQIVHGKSEHKERYLNFMEYMNSVGYACIIHDHRGHGNSVRSEEDLGYMYGVGTEGFLSDIHQITELALKRWPGLPLVMFGHGLGALAVRCCAKRWEEEVSCMILCGIPSKNPAVGSGLLFRRVVGLTQKKGTRNRIMDKIIHAPYDQKFPGETSEFGWLCSDPEAVEAYVKDPYCGFDLSMEGHEIFIQLMKETYRKTKWKTDRPDLPVLFIGGADDPYIVGPSTFHQTLGSMRSQGYRNVKGKLYPGLRHEILWETRKEQVFSDLEKYLQRALKTEEEKTEDS